jgi:hypothetical protein
MTNNGTPPAVRTPTALLIDRMQQQVEHLDEPGLEEAFRRYRDQAVEGVVGMAVIVRRWDDRGKDLSDYDQGFINSLRRVASGQLSPKLMERLKGRYAIQAKLARYPLAQQDQLAETCQVAVYVESPDGPTHRMVNVSALGREELRVVFAADHIRTPAEQAHEIDRLRRLASQPVPERVGKCGSTPPAAE